MFHYLFSYLKLSFIQVHYFLELFRIFHLKSHCPSFLFPMQDMVKLQKMQKISFALSFLFPVQVMGKPPKTQHLSEPRIPYQQPVGFIILK